MNEFESLGSELQTRRDTNELESLGSMIKREDKNKLESLGKMFKH